MFKPSRSHRGLLGWFSGRMLRISTGLQEDSFREMHLWEHFIRGQKVGHGMAVDGMAKSQALKFTFQDLRFPVKSLALLVRRRIPQKFEALKFQNSGAEIWRIHPPPFHAPLFACLRWSDRQNCSHNVSHKNWSTKCCAQFGRPLPWRR